MDLFKDYTIEGIDSLRIYTSRDGFYLIDNSEYHNMMSYFSQFEVYNNLAPFLTDNENNYWCVYTSGVLKNKVCYLSHEEIYLQPVFKNIVSLLDLLNNNPSFYDYHDIPVSKFDYPSNTSNNEDKNIVKTLLNAFSSEVDETVRQQLAFCIMNLTSLSDIETIYPFLYDEDMYIQEFAIKLLGYWKYSPAQQILQELQTSALPNGQTAAKAALKNIKQANYLK